MHVSFYIVAWQWLESELRVRCNEPYSIMNTNTIFKSVTTVYSNVGYLFVAVSNEHTASTALFADDAVPL